MNRVSAYVPASDVKPGYAREEGHDEGGFGGRNGLRSPSAAALRRR